MYSIWDSGCKRNLETGRNSETEYDCVQAGVEYVSEDCGGLIRNEMTFEEKKKALLGYNLHIYEHTQPVEEFDIPNDFGG